MAKLENPVKKVKYLNRESVVLTAELKEQVNARIAECIKMAKELWLKVRFLGHQKVLRDVLKIK